MNKVALITGAAKRIGASIARNIHGAGYNVIIHYHHSKPEAEQLAQELNVIRTDSASSISLDLFQHQHCAQLIDYCIERHARFDVLVNNASVFFPTALNTVSEKQWLKIMDVNVKAPLFLCKEASAHLKKNNGSIINITDIHGDKPLSDHVVYSTTKAALIMLTKALAKELAPEVRVNAVSPGAIEWPETMNDKEKDVILNKIPLQTKGGEQDIANAVLFLLNQADYMTGQVINVDGGRGLTN